MKKKYGVLVFLGILFLIIFVCTNLNHFRSKPKIGVNSFNVASDEIKITYNKKEYILTGREREKFVDILVNICQEEEVDCTEKNDNTEYDILLDFKNGNNAKISSKERMLDLGYGVVDISKENMDKIKEIFEHKEN
ncbi:hypothetical protein SAMN02745111_00003 [Eubacterium uniforme]|uniref:Uncharacterized protein n=1 Tax=Eubacterium uniforme TaxID=39495 RepID=A0A1T4V3H8_9FIRM|nr:hypothetical protein [Eubacterium uniforme]SKA59478.1 hypothetical protein SAMN02745111_00003 [Eubacterium uniforme]